MGGNRKCADQQHLHHPSNNYNHQSEQVCRSRQHHSLPKFCQHAFYCFVFSWALPHPLDLVPHSVNGTATTIHPIIHQSCKKSVVFINSPVELIIEFGTLLADSFQLIWRSCFDPIPCSINYTYSHLPYSCNCFRLSKIITHCQTE